MRNGTCRPARSLDQTAVMITLLLFLEHACIPVAAAVLEENRPTPRFLFLFVHAGLSLSLHPPLLPKSSRSWPPAWVKQGTPKAVADQGTGDGDGGEGVIVLARGLFEVTSPPPSTATAAAGPQVTKRVNPTTPWLRACMPHAECHRSCPCRSAGCAPAGL